MREWGVESETRVGNFELKGFHFMCIMHNTLWFVLSYSMIGLLQRWLFHYQHLVTNNLWEPVQQVLKFWNPLVFPSNDELKMYRLRIILLYLPNARNWFTSSRGFQVPEPNINPNVTLGWLVLFVTLLSYDLGPSIKDVRKFLPIFLPLPPLCPHVSKFSDPPDVRIFKKNQHLSIMIIFVNFYYSLLGRIICSDLYSNL